MACVGVGAGWAAFRPDWFQQSKIQRNLGFILFIECRRNKIESLDLVAHSLKMEEIIVYIICMDDSTEVVRRLMALSQCAALRKNTVNPLTQIVTA